MSDVLHNLLNALVGQETRAQLRRNAVDRGNIPCVNEHMASRCHRRGTDKLWIVDRVVEPQTVPHFISAVLGGKPFPDGAQRPPLNLPPDELFLITQPYSSWAPPPFNSRQTIPIEDLMGAIGSMEDSSRMQTISKELHAMKSRIWEGLMPLSARRWQERRLYEPGNFSAACQVLSMAVNLFHYFNDATVKVALRDTSNLIDAELRAFESALNAKRALAGRPPAEIAGLWLQFMRAQFVVMCNRTHAWVLEHVTHMKNMVLEQLEAHGTPSGGEVDEEQWRLTNMWQDLTEIASSADYAIFLPMDGYTGAEPEPERPEYDPRTQPLSVSPDIDQRMREYHQRRRHLNLTEMMQSVAGNLDNNAGPRPENDCRELLQRCREQETGQRLARAELRGEPVRYEKEVWAGAATGPIGRGFVAYRTYYSGGDAEWDAFRAKFEADISDWGRGLEGVEEMREKSRIHWLDARDMGVEDGDIEVLKSSFNSFADSDDFPSGFVRLIFLVADEATVSSYMKPQPESSPPGDAGGFILGVSADFDPAEGLERPDESPGFNGTLRVLGSLLWDDLSVLVAAQTQYLEDLWPLAMHHPSAVYVGPVVKAQRSAWEAN